MPTTKDDDIRLLTLTEAAGVLGIGKTKLHELLNAGELQRVRIGGNRLVRISRSRLNEYITSCEEQAA